MRPPHARPTSQARSLVHPELEHGGLPRRHGLDRGLDDGPLDTTARHGPLERPVAAHRHMATRSPGS